MHFAATFAQHGIVGDFLGERVLEGILAFRKDRPLVNEFAKLQSGQLAHQFIVGASGDVANQAERKFLADDGEGLQQLLFGSAQPIDSRGQNALNSPRNLNGREGSGQFDGAIAHERALIE